jgi:two-component system sensor histidine kinase YesM
MSYEMMALQSQINPHFLSNTLKTIFWRTVALTGGQNDASRMIDSLSHIMSYSLSDSRELVPLRDEMAYATNYASIQKIRFKGRFRLVWKYSGEILDYKCLKLLFQPLIENSITHGAVENGTECLIKISLREHRGRLCVFVRDNGAGIDSGKLAEIQARLSDDDDNFSHIGMRNIYRRLRLTYGDRLTFKLKSFPAESSPASGGTLVFFSFPAEK